MALPDYKKRSIVNLMSSIEKALGGKPIYPQLNILKPDALKKYQNIVLIIIDGLGYEYLKKYGKGTILKKHLKGKITSVFPATTTAAIPSFITGVAPQQHGLTGWHMYLKEIGTVVTLLKLKARTGQLIKLDKRNAAKIYSQKPIFDKIRIHSYAILQKKKWKDPLTKIVFGKTKRTGYDSIDEMFYKLKKIIRTKKRKFIYAYWPGLDAVCHKNSTTGRKTLLHFKQINTKTNSLLKAVRETNTLLIITADHGMKDTPKQKRILLDEHPQLKETLTLPLCGESRTAYCYVHPSKTKEFEKYVKTRLKKACTLHKSKSLIKKNYFGLFTPNKRTLQRIGDYVLITKNNYTIKDWVLGEKKYCNKSSHGGTSKEEMHVPLILIDCKK